MFGYQRTMDIIELANIYNIRGNTTEFRRKVK